MTTFGARLHAACRTADRSAPGIDPHARAAARTGGWMTTWPGSNGSH